MTRDLLDARKFRILTCAGRIAERPYCHECYRIVKAAVPELRATPFSPNVTGASGEPEGPKSE
jgi:hypothetical protein